MEPGRSMLHRLIRPVLIQEFGICHLSGDEDTAVKVGSRHGKPVIYKVAAGKMERAGYAFFLSVNGVWLTKEVPKEYLIKME